MTANVGGIDRILRIVAGLVLIALAATGVFRFCGAYTLFGVNTCPMKAVEEEPAK